MNIGVIGWWNYDNQGDLAMLAALRQGLAPHHVVPIDTGFSANPDTIYRLNRLDYVLLGGGTLIPGKPTAPFDTFDRWADELHCPLGVVGLGVNPIQEQFWPAIEALLDRAEFFHVRDQASCARLHDHPKVQVAPDLTFAYPLSVSDRCFGEVETIPVCGVNLRRSASFDPAPWLEALARLPVQIKGLPLSSFDVFDEDELLKQLDPQRPERFDAALYRQIDVMIGTAFHSILFAVQAAVPVIAIGYAPKVCDFMEDNGLARFLLAPDEHDRLPELVDDVLAQRSDIAIDLRASRARLHRVAEQSIDCVRGQIEQSGPRHCCTGPTVTVAVLGSGNIEKDQRTLASCASQTYENVEVLLVSPDPWQSAGARLQQTLAQSHGAYLTWVEGGDWFADDALDCLVSLLEENRHWDVAYTDYYAMSSAHLPVGCHTVPGPEKLYRRDVVGPCFVMRRVLLAQLNQVITDAPLVAYGLWLRISASSLLVPVHAPLFYSARPIRSLVFVEEEREVRRRWRKTQPVWTRAAWNALDTDLGEQIIVQPLARFQGLLKSRNYGGRR